MMEDTDFRWTKQEDDAFQKVKDINSSIPSLQYYDINKDFLLSVDASSKAFGATLLKVGKPVAHASKSLTQTEQAWSQIEKELGAIVFGAEHLHRYVYRKAIQVETDRKPLISIAQKPLEKTPARLLNLRFKLMLYDISLRYTKEKSW